MKFFRVLGAGAAAMVLGLALAAVPPAQAQTQLVPASQPVGGQATDWLRDAKFGVMQHWLGEGCPGGGCGDPAPTAENWNTRVNAYDVDGVVAQLKSIGAKYLILAIGQNDGFWSAPNSAYDEIVTPTADHPSRLSTRDLIADMGTALHNAGLKFIVYAPADTPNRDDYARRMLGGPQPDGTPNSSVYQQNWIRILTTWSSQWGTRVDGYWADGTFRDPGIASTQPTPYPDLGSYYTAVAAALRAGNPNALVGLNPGYGSLLPRSSQPVSDFTPGEFARSPWPPHGVTTRFVPDRGTQLQFHTLLEAQTSWGAAPNRPMTFSDDDIVAKTLTVTGNQGVTTWDVGYDRSNGHLSDLAVTQLAKVGQAVGNLPGPLRGVGSDKCVDVPGFNTQDRTNLILYTCNGGTNQQWTFTSTNGEVRSLGKCMEVADGSSSDGNYVRLNTCDGSAGQKWTYDPDSRRLQALGKCLDAKGAGTADLTSLIVWTCHTNDNQKWRRYS
ncbi:ricin-type beta-trefoil lectin domain protein [Kitasatospora xanthocidica]|uniref:ricin-type beta-trefoil lectin domain protein n=1 Tax=Kitasatospora xanthocidica TaxID=83382 RepID=UPI0036EF6895